MLYFSIVQKYKALRNIFGKNQKLSNRELNNVRRELRKIDFPSIKSISIDYHQWHLHVPNN